MERARGETENAKLLEHAVLQLASSKIVEVVNFTILYNCVMKPQIQACDVYFVLLCGWNEATATAHRLMIMLVSMMKVAVTHILVCTTQLTQVV